VLHLLLLFLIYLSSFIDSSQTNYLKIYRTDLRQIFWVVGVMAVDDQSEISFSICQGTLAFCWFHPQNRFAGRRRVVFVTGGKQCTPYIG